MHTAIIKALEERQRQINEEGFSLDHDDHHDVGELTAAAASYATAARVSLSGPVRGGPYAPWPFQNAWWKPSEDPNRNIIKAMALLSAEYDRLERAEAATVPVAPPEKLYSTDDEWQDGSHDDLHDLIVDREREAGDVVYRGVKRHPLATEFTCQLFDEVKEHMQLQAEDGFGDVAENYPETTKDQCNLLQALIDAWATTYCPPDFYTIADVQEITVTQGDVLLANQECN